MIFLVVEAGGSAAFGGADSLEPNEQYHAMGFLGAVYDEPGLRSWAGSVGSAPPLPADAALEDLAARVNALGWRVLQMIGSDQTRLDTSTEGQAMLHFRIPRPLPRIGQ